MNKKNKHIHSEVVFPIKNNMPAILKAGAIITQCLWPDKPNSKKEILYIKGCLMTIIFDYGDPYVGYLEYCQRILLAKMRLIYNRQTLNISVKEWLELEFAKTKEMYNQLQEIRKKTPLYKHDLKSFAECILDLVEDPDADISYWVNWYKERNANDEFNRIINLHFALLENPSI